MGYFQFAHERVTLELRGSIAGTFLRLLIQWVFSQLVLPTAWGIAILNRWLVKWVRFSDGTTATFVGRPVQVWGWIALSVAMYHVPNLVVCVISSSNPFACMLDPQVRQDALADGGPSARNFNVATGLAILPIVIYVELVVYRWIVAGVRLRGGPALQFTGSYLPLLGWTVLIVVSVPHHHWMGLGLDGIFPMARKKCRGRCSRIRVRRFRLGVPLAYVGRYWPAVCLHLDPCAQWHHLGLELGGCHTVVPPDVDLGHKLVCE